MRTIVITDDGFPRPWVGGALRLQTLHLTPPSTGVVFDGEAVGVLAVADDASRLGILSRFGVARLALSRLNQILHNFEDEPDLTVDLGTDMEIARLEKIVSDFRAECAITRAISQDRGDGLIAALRRQTMIRGQDRPIEVSFAEPNWAWASLHQSAIADPLKPRGREMLRHLRSDTLSHANLKAYRSRGDERVPGRPRNDVRASLYQAACAAFGIRDNAVADGVSTATLTGRTFSNVVRPIETLARTSFAA